MAPGDTDDQDQAGQDRIAELEAQLAARDAQLAAHDAQLAARDAEIVELKAIVAKVTAQLEVLTEKLGQNSKNSHLPPSSDGPGSSAKKVKGRSKKRPSKRKRGGQKGRRGAHRAYCRAFAAALGLPIYFSWKVGGFEGELLRRNARTQPIRFETPSGVRQVGGARGKFSTRLKFPQVTPDLSKRWCSAYLKIDPCRRALANDPRFGNGARTLVVTGERAEESASRARYKRFEPHATDSRAGRRQRTRRHIDALRPVHAWTTSQVWSIIRSHRINPHPCYRVGFGRASCMKCIFGNADQWATIASGPLASAFDYSGGRRAKAPIAAARIT